MYTIQTLNRISDCIREVLPEGRYRIDEAAQAPDAAGKTPGLNGQEIGAGPGTLWCGTAGPGLRAVFGLSPGLPFCPVGRWGWLRTPSMMFLLFHKSPLEYENHKKLQIVTAPYHTSF